MEPKAGGVGEAEVRNVWKKCLDRVAMMAIIGGWIGTMAGWAWGQDRVHGNLILLNNNGAWSWFQDERAVIDPAAGKLLVSSIADGSGLGGASRDGNVDIVALDLRSGVRQRFTLADITADDHNSAAILIRPDGRYLAMYANHGSDNYTRYRISTNPGDITSWQSEQVFNNGVGTTYSNLCRLAEEGRIYNFTRTNGYDPNILVSGDEGSSWSYLGVLLRDPAASSSHRPYVKYASNGTNRIYFITTEAHPRDWNTGIYAGYLEGGQLYRMDGTILGGPGAAPAAAISATDFTTVFAPNTVVNGTIRDHAWTIDLALDTAGRPYGVFSSRVNNDSTDHRFYYARWNGSAWQVYELAKAGGYLYAAENDYTGLVALVPGDPNTVYIATKVHPVTEAALAHYEIFKGVTSDGGASWSWTAVTEDSTVDNIRPIVPAGSPQAVLWLRGTYSTYTNFDMAVVGLVAGLEASGAIQYVDATRSNTTRASGSGSWCTGPSGSAGATDGLWHERSGYGNGGSVFTADELATENAPMLVTTVTGLEAGRYDVWVYFWSDEEEAWQIRAGLSSTDLVWLDKQTAQHVLVEELIGAEVDAIGGSGGQRLYQAYLGRVSVDAAGLLRVYIDDGSGSGTERTWYDGIGYARVPELLGDTNGDGVVDLADYNNVVNNLGAADGGLGDTNGDGVVDLADYNNVVNNLGASQGVFLAAPESGGLAAWIMAIAATVLCRGRAF